MGSRSGRTRSGFSWGRGDVSLRTLMGPQIRQKWSGSLSRGVRLARFWTLFVGLALEVLLTAVVDSNVAVATFAVGIVLFAATTIMTWTPAFTDFHVVTMTVIPLADFVTLALFDFIPGADPAAALVAVPAMWLGFVLGRPGVAVATLSSVVVTVMPGVAFGLTHDPVIDEVSAILFAAIASAGLALSTETWARQLARIEEQGAQLQRASRIKDDFIATVSHELRTPLTSIIGYLDLINDDDSPKPRHHVGFLDAMGRNAERLLTLVTDLLRVVEVEDGATRLDTQAIDLSSLVQVRVTDCSQRATSAGLQMRSEIDAGLMVIADATQMGHVIDNLLSNAVKFTPGPGEVTVGLHRVVGGVELTVQDTGIGVSAPEIDNLGTKFFRTRRATELAIPGVGVGLTLTKSIVTAHEGLLEFISREDEGTSVRVFLPAAEHTLAAQEPGRTPPDTDPPAREHL